MDDPTKDTIPRSAVEYYLRKETVNTNPDAYESHERFIAYMDDPDISQFGHWMHSNGFNCALVSIAVDLDKIPSVTPSAQPGWIPCSERLPEKSDQYYVSGGDKVWICEFLIIPNSTGGWCNDVANPAVQAWMPLPKPWEGDKNE